MWAGIMIILFRVAGNFQCVGRDAQRRYSRAGICSNVFDANRTRGSLSRSIPPFMGRYPDPVSPYRCLLQQPVALARNRSGRCQQGANVPDCQDCSTHRIFYR